MKQWNAPDCGTLRITNPNTLKKWIDNGKYHKMINEGFIYAVYCGRFRTDICKCSLCINKKK